MWKETVNANCSRDRSNAERSIVRPYRHKLNRLHANTRKISIVLDYCPSQTNKRNASLHGALPRYAKKTSPYAARRQFWRLERSDLLHAGRSGCRLGGTALNFSLQAGETGLVLRLRRMTSPKPASSPNNREAGLLRSGALIEGGARKAGTPVQECCGFSDTSLSLSAIRPSSGSERAFIFRIALLRWTFTVASAMPISPAICLLRRPCAT